jgi:AcrR family transcriptional regulator
MPGRAKKNLVHMRDAQATRGRILDAVGSLLVREGFGALGVNAVAREADVDKVLIYRYFGGMDQLLETWGNASDFWPTVEEVLGPEPEPELASLVSGLLKRHLRALRARPHTLEVLAWETVTRHPLTAILDRIRETRSEQLMEALPDKLRESELDIFAFSALMGAGMQHLLLRSRTVEVFNGVPIGTPAGWERLEQAVDDICVRVFNKATPKS